ncbi:MULTISPECIES: hypothetical protein [Actinoplanes]|uniref:hypothetical protein n=1 Tax=Actinoplanes TaxID=1865 RepID=UPI0005F2CB06|nr:MULTISPECIES: hypothetical protein [Actinoplanes]GLY02058.1 hypothetical protein Acsp01_24370 [Actinoplanes sp. NBRC 101535]
MRFALSLSAVVLVGLAGGCTSSDESPETPAPSTAASPPAWSEPAAYSFVLSRGCDEKAPIGRYQATVADGVITAATPVGGAAPVPSASASSSEEDLGPANGQEGEEIEVPTLAELVVMAETAKEDGAEVTTVQDGTDGHPVSVSINVTDTVDGAECWFVSDYKP